MFTHSVHYDGGEEEGGVYTGSVVHEFQLTSCRKSEECTTMFCVSCFHCADLLKFRNFSRL